MIGNVDNRTVAAGSLMLISFGSYSDYRVNALVVVLKTFETASIQSEYVDDVPADQLKDARWSYNNGRFLPWIIRKGYVAEVQHGEWCLGGYQLFDEDGAVHLAFEVKP